VGSKTEEFNVVHFDILQVYAVTFDDDAIKRLLPNLVYAQRRHRKKTMHK